MRSSPFRRLATGLVLVALACVSLTWTSAAQAQRRQRDRAGAYLRSSPEILSAFRDVVAGPGKSTVRVRCDGKDVALGTVVEADGWILTKASELKGKVSCKLKDGDELDARVAGVQESYDLALLKIDAKGLQPVEWADSKTALVGNWLASPGMSKDPAAIGVVSVATRSIPVRRGAPVNNPSSSGFLGISVGNSERGAKIDQVIAGSAAEKVGLKPDDIIVSVGGEVIADSEALLSLLQAHKPGDNLQFRVKRGDDEFDVKVTLGKRPASLNRGEVQNHMGGELSERRTGFPTILQHDSVLRPRDCGGPVVDLDGKAIGINIARAGRTESYAVPSEVIRPLLKDLKSGKLAPRPVKEEKPAKKAAS